MHLYYVLTVTIEQIVRVLYYLIFLLLCERFRRLSLQHISVFRMQRGHTNAGNVVLFSLLTANTISHCLKLKCPNLRLIIFQFN